MATKLELEPEVLEVTETLQEANHAGMSKDGEITWVYKDALLDVSMQHTNHTIASWRFGKVLLDPSTKICCVTELKYAGGRLLLVATSNFSDKGMLCFFCLTKRMVIRAVEFPNKITSLEVIFENYNEDVPSWMMSKHLQFFCGLAAVGTEGGFVYLVDLCLDELMINHTTEAAPKKLDVTSPAIVDPNAARTQARMQKKHLALLLDELCHRQGSYYYRRQNDTVQKILDEGDVSVTCLRYITQAGILSIGFNFGGFQLWKMYSPTLEYSSRYSADGKTVSEFVVQEPENDPRKLMYLWVAYDKSINESDSVSSIALYQLCFCKKDLYPKFGLYYDDLESVCPRLEHKLTVDPYSSDVRMTWSSHMICAYTVINPLHCTPSSQPNDSFDEGPHGNDLSLSVFVWRATSKQSGGVTRYWMVIFDLNRWYHAQMPHYIRCTGTSPQVCSYWAVYKLDEVAAVSSPPSLLSVQINWNKVLRFVKDCPLPPDEYSYPSAVQFAAVWFVGPHHLIQGRCNGWQGQLLQNLAQNGAKILVKPSDFYHQCLRARLISQVHDEWKSHSFDHQRQTLLSLSMEYALTPSLVGKCIQLWSDGEFVDSGCDLSLLLGWAWDSVVAIKLKLDEASDVLYNQSGIFVDPHTERVIQSNTCALSCIKHVFTNLMSHSGPITDQGQSELEIRHHVISILLYHFEVVLWAMSYSLLPEIDEDSSGVEGLFAYPVSKLEAAYNKRKLQFADAKGILPDKNLMLIDNLVERGGEQIQKLWEIRGGEELYPPRSMQVVMHMFLQEEVSLQVKQAITLYLLLDMASLLGTDDSQIVVASFIQRFFLKPSLVHIVQGLWNIDHGDFEEGIRQLLNPNVQDNMLGDWLDSAVVNTLLAQGQVKAATRYIHSGHLIGANFPEQQLVISVMLQNGNISHALNFMRNCQSVQNCGVLMAHVWNECQKYKLVDKLLQENLNEMEESHLEKHLRIQDGGQSLEPLLLYYLQRSRYVQAFQLNDEINKITKFESSLVVQQKSLRRNRLMDAYLKALPEVTRKLVKERHKASFLPPKKFEVERPKPLSTVVRNNERLAMSRSNFVMAVMEKAVEANHLVEEMEEEHIQEAPKIELSQQVEDKLKTQPFLNTPCTPLRKSFLCATEVVYPQSHTSPININPLLSAAKKSSLAVEDSEGDEQTKDRKSLYQLTIECLKVLETPKKEPRTPSVKVQLSALPSTQVKTPQSILKVRRLSRSSPKDASSMKRTPNSRSKRASGSKSDSVLSSPLSVSVVSTKEVTEQSVKSTAVTPKRLRFVGISPSPTPSPSVVVSEQSFERGDTSGSHSEDRVEANIVEEKDNSQESLDQAEIAATLEKQSQKVENSEDVDMVEVTKESTEIDKKEEHVSEENIEMVMEKSNSIDDKNEEKQVLSFAERPVDRHSEEMDDLVRPDLHSPLKEHEEQKTVVQESSTLIEKSSTTINTEGSPTSQTALTTETQENVITSKMFKPMFPVDTPSSHDGILKKPREEEDNFTRLQREELDSLVSFNTTITQSVRMNKTLSETTTDSFSRSSMVEQTDIINPLSSQTVSEISHMKEVSSLSIQTSSTQNLSQRTLRERSPSSVSPVITRRSYRMSVTPERKTLEQDQSPPATPPLSKKLKMIIREETESGLILKTQGVGVLSYEPKDEDMEKNTERQKMQAVSDKESAKEGSDYECVVRNLRSSPSRSSPSRMRKTPERRSPSRKSLRLASHLDEEEITESQQTLPEEETCQSSSRKRRASHDSENEEQIQTDTDVKSRLRRSPARRLDQNQMEAEVSHEAGPSHKAELQTRKSSEREFSTAEEVATRSVSRRSPSRNTQTQAVSEEPHKESALVRKSLRNLDKEEETVEEAIAEVVEFKSQILKENQEELKVDSVMTREKSPSRRSKRQREASPDNESEVAREKSPSRKVKEHHEASLEKEVEVTREKSPSRKSKRHDASPENVGQLTREKSPSRKVKEQHEASREKELEVTREKSTSRKSKRHHEASPEHVGQLTREKSPSRKVKEQHEASREKELEVTHEKSPSWKSKRHHEGSPGNIGQLTHEKSPSRKVKEQHEASSEKELEVTHEKSPSWKSKRHHEGSPENVREVTHEKSTSRKVKEHHEASPEKELEVTREKSPSRESKRHHEASPKNVREVTHEKSPSRKVKEYREESEKEPEVNREKSPSREIKEHHEASPVEDPRVTREKSPSRNTKQHQETKQNETQGNQEKFPERKSKRLHEEIVERASSDKPHSRHEKSRSRKSTRNHVDNEDVVTASEPDLSLEKSSIKTKEQVTLKEDTTKKSLSETKSESQLKKLLSGKDVFVSLFEKTKRSHSSITPHDNPPLDSQGESKEIEKSMEKTSTHSEAKNDEKEEIFVSSDKFINQLAEPVSHQDVPSSPSRRKSTRLHTPDRTGDLLPGLSPTFFRRTSSSRARTPSASSTTHSSVKAEESKTLPKKHKVNKQSVETQNTDSSTSSKTSTSQTKKEKSEESSAEKAKSDESKYSTRSSRRRSRTPDPIATSSKQDPGTPVRRSKRHLKSPEKLNTPEIQPMSSKFSPSPKRPLDVNEKSPLKEQKSKTEGKKLDYSEDEEQVDTRRQTRNRSKSPSRLDATVSKKPSEETVFEEQEDWSDEMPPLRLEVEEEEQTHRMTNTMSQRASVTSKTASIEADPIATTNTSSTQDKPGEHRVNELTSNPVPSFIFSPPVRRMLRSSDSMVETKESSEVFSFRQPTAATEEASGGDEDLAVKRGTHVATTSDQDGNSSRGESGTFTPPERTRRKSKAKQRRTLFQNDSPALLSPVEDSAKAKRTRTRTRLSETQRLSVSIMQKYKPRQSLSRRVKPSTSQ